MAYLDSCLFCGQVDRCESPSNRPYNCANFLRRAGTRDLIKMGVFTRTAYISPDRHDGEFTDYEIKIIKSLISKKHTEDEYIIRIKGNEVYFRPRIMQKKWESKFYEKNKLQAKYSKINRLDNRTV